MTKMLLTIGIILAIMFGLIFLSISSISESEKRPCSYFANRSQRDLPARCINYFQYNE